MTKSFGVLLLFVGLAFGCNYLDRPSGRILTTNIYMPKAGIRFGGETAYLSANIDKAMAEVIPYREFVKVGDTAKADLRYKVIVSALVQSTVLNKEAWPFVPPTATIQVDLFTSSGVVLSSQNIPYQFHLDANPDYATVTFSGLTSFDLDRLNSARVAWVYSR